jgi:hypothetical protein
MFQIISFSMVVLCLISPLMAQSLAGKVTDPQGGAIPGAQVRLYVRETGNRLSAIGGLSTSSLTKAEAVHAAAC